MKLNSECFFDLIFLISCFCKTKTKKEKKIRRSENTFIISIALKYGSVFFFFLLSDKVVQKIGTEIKINYE